MNRWERMWFQYHLRRRRRREYQPSKPHPVDVPLLAIAYGIAWVINHRSRLRAAFLMRSRK